VASLKKEKSAIIVELDSLRLQKDTMVLETKEGEKEMKRWDINE
jgi:hypothetical protein